MTIRSILFTDSVIISDALAFGIPADRNITRPMKIGGKEIFVSMWGDEISPAGQHWTDIPLFEEGIMINGFIPFGMMKGDRSLHHIPQAKTYLLPVMIAKNHKET